MNGRCHLDTTIESQCPRPPPLAGLKLTAFIAARAHLFQLSPCHNFVHLAAPGVII
jgi:hypothetical protein